jgi:hypothetical protein
MYGGPSKSHRTSGSVTATTALLNQKLATSNAPRMLTPSEIELLKQSKREIALRIKAKQRGAVTA